VVRADGLIASDHACAPVALPLSDNCGEAKTIEKISLPAVDPASFARRRVESETFKPKKENFEMKYMLLIYDNEQAWTRISEAEQRKIYGEYMQFTEDIKASRNYLAGAQLHPVATASSVRVRNGKDLVTDGPFAETHEQLGGYYLVEAKDLDEATKIAARIPSARLGTVEVRPVVERSAEATA